MHRFDVKTIKTIKTTQNYKCDQITMNLHRFDVNTIKNVEYVAKHSKQRKTTKVIKLWQVASIWRQNDQKSWVTSQNIPNNAKLRKWSKYNYLHRLDVEKIKNFALSRKTFKPTQNYKSDHITMNLHRFDVKTIKTSQTKKATKLQWIASIGRRNNKKCWVTSQNIQTNAKLQNWSNYNYLHQF